MYRRDFSEKGWSLVVFIKKYSFLKGFNYL